MVLRLKGDTNCAATLAHELRSILTIISADWLEATSSFVKVADRARQIEGLSRAVRW